MPAEYRVDEALGCVFSRGFGVLTEEDLFEHDRHLAADPAFKADMKQRWDFLELVEVQISGAAVQRFAKANPFSPESRRAGIVASPLVYGLIRMFEAYARLPVERIQIFPDARGADEWLGIAEGGP